jgi:hypothetical protein
MFAKHAYPFAEGALASVTGESFFDTGAVGAAIRAFKNIVDGAANI